MKRAVFLDRDGVINELVYYEEQGIIDSPFTVEQLKLFSWAGEAIKKLTEAGYKVVIVSNQPGIAKGRLSRETFEKIREKMKKELAKQGAFVDGEYYCFHHPDARVESLRANCECRKPRPGLLFQAARELDIDLSQSWMIGDGLTDVKAGKAAGCKTILLGKMKCELCRLMDEEDAHPDAIAANLLEVVAKIEGKTSHAMETTNRFVSNREGFVNKVAEYIPFAASNLIWRFLNNSNQSLLDVGCGSGRPGGIIKRHRNVFSVGVDIFRPYLQHCKENHTHDELIQCDVRKLPFKKKSFDAVLCKEVIEHLDKQEGDELIKELERVAQSQLILTTPVGAYEQHEYDDNPFQQHRSAREPSDLKHYGFTVRGVGIRSMHGERGFQSRIPQPFRWLLDILYVLAGPFVYFLPKFACHMVCTKRLKPNSSSRRRWTCGLKQEGEQLDKLGYEATILAQKKSLSKLFGIDADGSFFLDKDVLEVGCTPFSLIHGMSRSCFKVGIDPLASSNKFKEFYQGGTFVHHTAGMAEHLPFRDNSFDVVLCINTLDHVLDPYLGLKEIVRVLRGEGSALLVVHTFSLPRLVMPLLTYFDQHPHHFSNGDVAFLISESGAEVKYCRSRRLPLNEEVIPLVRKGLLKSAFKTFCAILLQIRDHACQFSKAT